MNNTAPLKPKMIRRPLFNHQEFQRQRRELRKQIPFEESMRQSLEERNYIREYNKKQQEEEVDRIIEETKQQIAKEEYANRWSQSEYAEYRDEYNLDDPFVKEFVDREIEWKANQPAQRVRDITSGGYKGSKDTRPIWDKIMEMRGEMMMAGVDTKKKAEYLKRELDNLQYAFIVDEHDLEYSLDRISTITGEKDLITNLKKEYQEELSALGKAYWEKRKRQLKDKINALQLRILYKKQKYHGGDYEETGEYEEFNKELELLKSQRKASKKNLEGGAMAPDDITDEFKYNWRKKVANYKDNIEEVYRLIAKGKIDEPLDNSSLDFAEPDETEENEVYVDTIEKDGEEFGLIIIDTVGEVLRLPKLGYKVLRIERNSYTTHTQDEEGNWDFDDKEWSSGEVEYVIEKI